MSPHYVGLFIIYIPVCWNETTKKFGRQLLQLLSLSILQWSAHCAWSLEYSAFGLSRIISYNKYVMMPMLTASWM